MAEESLDSFAMRDFVHRWQGGDPEAADALLRAARHRLERMTEKMLSDFPVVRKFAEASDVLQASSMRLLHALRELKPESKRRFYSLAAIQIRRELLDLARYFHRPAFRRAASDVDAATLSSDESYEGPATDTNVELWRQFHEAVDKLPTIEREVIGLVFYHGWTQRQIGELLQMDERTVRRRWQSACLQLRELVGTRLPRP
jgi:RNA polymerase sigma factor (sigma-70 family)